MKKVIKILPDITAQKNTLSNGVLRYIGINQASDVDGDVLMTNACYSEIFGTHKKSANNSDKRLSIVKISANGKSIHRSYRGVTVTGFNSSLVALSPNSIMLLHDSEGNQPQDVEVSKGCFVPFYWNHPDKSVRISVRMGLLSLVLGLISLVVSIMSLF